VSSHSLLKSAKEVFTSYDSKKDLFGQKLRDRDRVFIAFEVETLPRTRSALWLVLGRRVFGLMTLILEITYGLVIIVRPHAP
jgi:hypothetical protein